MPDLRSVQATEHGSFFALMRSSHVDSRQCKRKHWLRLTEAVCNIHIEYKSKIVHRKYKQQILPYLSLREHNILHR